MPRHRRTSIALLLAAALLLTACSGIPTSGTVTVGTTITEQDANDFEIRPLGPGVDATQEEVVRGFVAAFAGSRNDYEVARQYLSPEFAEVWDPRSSVVVRSAGTVDPLIVVDDDSLRYAITAAGTVDAGGAYVEADSATTVSRQFDFVQVDGQWRISAADDGIVLSGAQFQSLFSPHALYFLDPSGSRLVPDLRWFLGGTAAIRIVSTMLQGPPPWLRGAARTAFPEGTQLASPDLDIQAGVARVDLSSEALDADARERQLMQVQLSASLVNVANIRRVDLSVGGTPLDIDELGSSGPQADATVDARAVVQRNGEFGFLSGTEIDPLDDLAEVLAPLAATGATLTATQDAVAVLGADGVSVIVRGTGLETVLDTRSDLVVPSLDDFGFVWTASASDGSQVIAYDFSGASTSISTGLPPDEQIVSVEVSRDGTRVAILSRAASGQRLVVAGINRDPNQRQLPLTLSEPAVDSVLERVSAIDATWVDELSVATVGEEDGGTIARLFVIGGQRRALGQLPDGARSIVGGNGERGVRVVGGNGSIFVRSGSGWSDTGVAVDLIATQR